MTEIIYIVRKADYNAKSTGKFDNEGCELTEPSKEIDERTVREYKFQTKTKAEKYAQEIINTYKEKFEIKWLAYVEVVKCTMEISRLEI